MERREKQTVRLQPLRKEMQQFWKQWLVDCIPLCHYSQSASNRYIYLYHRCGGIHTNLSYYGRLSTSVLRVLQMMLLILWRQLVLDNRYSQVIVWGEGTRPGSTRILSLSQPTCQGVRKCHVTAVGFGLRCYAPELVFTFTGCLARFLQEPTWAKPDRQTLGVPRPGSQERHNRQEKRVALPTSQSSPPQLPQKHPGAHWNLFPAFKLIHRDKGGSQRLCYSHPGFPQLSYYLLAP